MDKIQALSICLLLFCFSSFQTFSQCYTERHNTSIDGVWLSCQSRTSPNSQRNRGHWISYELDDRKTITSFKIWNINHPEGISSGAKTLIIDYIDQNGEWVEHSQHSINAAEGSAFYEGEELSLDSEFISDHILLTISENHGGDCYGLAEVKIGVKSTSTSTEDIAADHFKIEISPNPFNELTTVVIDQLEQNEIRYELMNNLGQIVHNETVTTNNGKARFQILGRGLPSGTYHLKIIDGIKVSSRKISHHIQ